MKKNILYALAATGLFYLAVLYRSRALLAASGAAVLLAVFFLYLLSRMEKEVKYDLMFFYRQENHSEKEISAGAGKYLAGIRVENNSAVYFPRIKAKICLRQAGTGKRLWVKVEGRAPARESAELTGGVRQPEFGVWRAQCQSIVLYDWMNLLCLPRKVFLQKEILIVPNLYETNIKIGIRTRMFWAGGERYHPQISGDDASETLKLREYQKGDRLNRIHWKLSAKNDQLIVAEMSLPQGCNVAYFLDAAPSNLSDRKAKAYWGVVNSISQKLLEQECAHYLVWRDQEYGGICRRAIRTLEDLLAFWNEACGFVLERGADPKAYARAFPGEAYASWLAWNQDLELSCNGKFVARIKPERVEEQMLEIDLLL